METNEKTIIDENIYKLVGRNMRRRRQKLELTQQEVSRRIKLSEKYYANLERGVNRGRLGIYLKIAIGLNVTLDELLLGLDHDLDHEIYITQITQKLRSMNLEKLRIIQELITIILEV